MSKGTDAVPAIADAPDGTAQEDSTHAFYTKVAARLEESHPLVAEAIRDVANRFPPHAPPPDADTLHAKISRVLEAHSEMPHTCAPAAVQAAQRADSVALVALLPCPFCGSDDVGMPAIGFRVTCDNCGGRTDYFDDKAAAKAAWNRRAALLKATGGKS